MIGAGYLGLFGTGKLLALGGRGAVGLQGGIERRLSLGAALQLGCNAAVEVAQVLHQQLLLLLVLEGGGEAHLLAYPLFAGRFIHQRHVAEALGDGGQLLLLLPRPFIGLDGDGRVEFGACHPFEQGGALVGIRFEEGSKFPLRQDHRAAELLPGEAHQLVNAILQFPLAATEYLPRFHIGQGSLLRLKTPLRAVSRPAHRPAGQPDATIAATKLHLGKTAGVAATEDASYVVGLEFLLVIHAAHFGHVLAIGDKARHLVVEGQTNGVEQGAFACAGVAGDGKQTRGAERPLGKVDGEGAGQTGQILT